MDMKEIEPNDMGKMVSGRDGDRSMYRGKSQSHCFLQLHLWMR